jgi:hypothetical protein
MIRLVQNKRIFIFYFNLLGSVKVLVNVGPLVRTEYFSTLGIQNIWETNLAAMVAIKANSVKDHL